MSDSDNAKRYSGEGPYYDHGIAPVLREWRKRERLSQTDIATMIGGSCTQAEISKIERGWVGSQRYGRMQAFALAMGVPLDDLIRITDWSGRPSKVAREGSCCVR